VLGTATTPKAASAGIQVGGAALAGGLPGLGSSMIRVPYAGWQLGQAFGPAPNVHEWPPGLARRGTRTGEVAKAVEPTAPATTYPSLTAKG
jgi:hypothetical protein